MTQTIPTTLPKLAGFGSLLGMIMKAGGALRCIEADGISGFCYGEARILGAIRRMTHWAFLRQLASVGL